MQLHSPIKDPIIALAEAAGDCVLAVITGVDGPSYRPLGACMAILPGGERVGSLSSGCVEGDIVHHAEEVLVRGALEVLLYGRGSPFIDIQLPCGGGLQILLLPRPDRTALAELARRRAARVACTMVIDTSTGQISVAEAGETGAAAGQFLVRMLPEIFFYVFGKGPEASTFAGLVQSAGYPNLLLSPDTETLQFGADVGCGVQHLTLPEFPQELRPDHWSAVVLFFHDHEWEPPILHQALASDAFYIGAQGSARARDMRLGEIAALGATPGELARLKGPIGLVRSARDARTLAVSVLAEVLDVAR